MVSNVKLLKSNFSINIGQEFYIGCSSIFLLIRADNSGICILFSTRSVRQARNETPDFLHVFLMLANVSRQVRPDGLPAEPQIFLFFTYSRISLSLKLLCRGMSGRSGTRRSSDLFFNILVRAGSNEA